ncbi:hypothetical protein [Streptomyces sp. NPDC020983]|uniref:hypothetical protein n=1 Tax=Streptomyces sp. NPDC020983 TaxID=3365106 RepID=UPI0037BBE453
MTEQPMTPIEQHHYDTITERIGVNRLKAEAGERAQPAEPEAPAEQPMTVAEAITTEAVLKTLLDEIDAQYKAARAAVQQALDTQQQETGGTKFDATIPGVDGPVKVGTVSLSSGSAAAQVTDADAFTEWVRKAYPTEVKPKLSFEIQPAWRTDLLARATAAGAAVDTATGEAIPGVEMRAARARTHSVRFGKDGRAAVGEAWRAGLLGRVLPALAPAQPAEIQTCDACGSGYTYGQACQTCAFKARMAAEPDAAAGECGAREPEPRSGTQACVRPAGHGGSRHRDHWGNEWPTAPAADDATDGGAQ